MPARKPGDDVVKAFVARKTFHDDRLLLPKPLARIDGFIRVTLSCALIAACAASPAQARIKRIQITAKEFPTFGGYSWPGVGQYEKIVGKAYGELDPKNAKNMVIVDLQLAPKNTNGRIDYSFDFCILKPIDPAKGNHKMLYEPPNRQEDHRRSESWSRR